MFDGDHLIALNPVPADDVAYQHETIVLLVVHHRRAGYRRFVIINHIWRTNGYLRDLHDRLLAIDPGGDARVSPVAIDVTSELAAEA